MNIRMKAVEMKNWAAYLFKLAVLRDLFEIQEIGERLRERSDFTYSNSALGQYFKGTRNPPANFFDYVRVALELTDEEYQVLLFLYHASKPTPSPVQQQQMRHFKTVLLTGIINSLKGENGIGAAS